MFVYSELDEGVGYASVFGHAFHLINSDEYAVNRVVNFRGGNVPGHSDQRGLYVDEEVGTGEDCGWTYNSPNPTNIVGKIEIYTNLIQEEYDNDNLGEYSVSDGIDAVIGHEIGHGMNLSHCATGYFCLMKGGASVLFLINQGCYDSPHNTQFDLK